MGIIQQIPVYQLFKIAFLHRLFQIVKGFLVFQMEGGLSVIQPAVQRPESVHKALGSGTVVRLAVTELIEVQSGQQALSVNPLVSQPSQRSLYNCKEFTLLLRIGILGNDGKIRLQNPAVIASQYILTNPRINQCLLQGRSRRINQGIFQNLEGHIKYRIQIRTHHGIDGKIGPVLCPFLLCDRVGDFSLDRLFKGLLHSYGRVCMAVLSVILSQIFLVQPCKLLGHIHVPVEIDIAVGRMVVIAVERNEFFIGKLRYHGRISARLIGVGRIRKEHISGKTVQNTFR